MVRNGVTLDRRSVLGEGHRGQRGQGAAPIVICTFSR